jgi:IBR domain, a half RING-finger domain
MVQLSVARPHLSAEEIAQFKAKYEEWNTPNRLYCPVPACSTFISPRLINAAMKAATTAAEQERQQKQANDSVTVVFGTGVKMQVVDPQTPLTLKPLQQPVIVDCPTCTSEICTSCKQFAHPPLPCEADSDIPPEFANLLKKWKVKRCPKCKTAIRRMYGCPHIRCRCGAQFCWFCLGPIDECRDIGCPEQDAADRDEAGYDTEEDDEADNEDGEEGICEDEPDCELQRIDRRRARALEAGDLDAAVERRDQLDLGDEPNADEVDPWNCEHSWRRAGDSNQNLPKGAPPKELECHRCWRQVIHALDAELNLDKLFEPDKAAGKEKEAAKANIQPKIEEDNGARPGHECRTCGVVYCNECKDEVDVENRNRWEEFERKAREASQDI